MMTGQPFTIHNSNVDANRNNVAVDPIAAGDLQRRRPERHHGREQGRAQRRATVRARCRSTCAPATGCGRAQGRTLDLFFEVFNITNEPNFANPTGDHAVGHVPRADLAGRRRVPAAVPGRRAVRVLDGGPERVGENGRTRSGSRVGQAGQVGSASGAASMAEPQPTPTHRLVGPCSTRTGPRSSREDHRSWRWCLSS